MHRHLASIALRPAHVLAPFVALAPLLAFATSAHAQSASSDGSEWDRARAQVAANPSNNMAYAIARWKLLSSNPGYTFGDYSSFLLTYPGFPDEDKLRASAEASLERGYVDPRQVVAFFDRLPPLTNPGRAQYALALDAMRRTEATAMARQAWRGGTMAPTAEATILSRFWQGLGPADHDARMDALLWDSNADEAAREVAYTSPAARPTAMARLALVRGVDPASQGILVLPDALSDPGYLYNKSRQLRRSGQDLAAAALLANRPPLSRLPLDQRKWVGELLATARGADSRSAVRIASSIDDAFAPGTDISTLSFGLRDDYTSLMWLGGTTALWQLGDARSAAPLFYRYGAAAKTPQTRSKGFYWAGRAMLRAGQAAEASRYFALAARYPEYYYGQLSLERLGRPMGPYTSRPLAQPTQQQRIAFYNRPLTAAVREVARESDWPTGVRFFREIANQAVTETDHALVAELAQEIGRRDLGVILGQAAQADGYAPPTQIAFPLVPTPPGTNWTMVHAISRQESQFATNAVSRVGARGLMQLMPRTAREQAGKVGLSYEPQALGDTSYNIRLGDAYFARMMTYFNGSYPLAVAAYNAGPGNVNKWLRTYGDPRTGAIDWIDWVERIPLSETRGYVQHVLENAVVYENAYPQKVQYGAPKTISQFLGRSTRG